MSDDNDTTHGQDGSGSGDDTPAAPPRLGTDHHTASYNPGSLETRGQRESRDSKADEYRGSSED